MHGWRRKWTPNVWGENFSASSSHLLLYATFLHQVDPINLNLKWFDGSHPSIHHHWIRTSGISRLAGSPTILGFTHHNLETFKGTVSNNTFNTCHCHPGFAPITQFDLVFELDFSWQLEAGPVLVHANLPLPFYILSTHWRFSVLFIDPVGLSLQNGIRTVAACRGTFERP